MKKSTVRIQLSVIHNNEYHFHTQYWYKERKILFNHHTLTQDRDSSPNNSTYFLETLGEDPGMKT